MDARIDTCNESSHCSSNENILNLDSYSVQNDSYTHDITPSHGQTLLLSTKSHLPNQEGKCSMSSNPMGCLRRLTCSI